MKCDILYFSDRLGFEDDVYLFKKILEHAEFTPTSLIHTYDVIYQDDVSGKDLIFLDYGGLSKGQEYFKMVRHYHKLIIENQEKQFIIALTMPKWFYESEEIFSEPNVLCFDRFDNSSYEKLFKPYKE